MGIYRGIRDHDPCIATWMNKTKMSWKKEAPLKKRLTKKTLDAFMEDMSLAAFYQGVAEEFGFTVEESHQFDCRKILIASSILNRWEEQFVEKYGKDRLWQLFAHLLNSGPKEKKELLPDEAEILEGFLVLKANDGCGN